MSRIHQIVSALALLVTLAIVWQIHLVWISAAVPDQDADAFEIESDGVSLDEPNIADTETGPPHAFANDLSKRKNYPPNPHTLTVVAVGDVHGDFSTFISVLQKADVVDADANWSGHVDYLVQTGDMMDRGTDTIRLYKYMDDLRAQAKAAGGRVQSLLGNHEYMNLKGQWEYVTAAEIETFGTRGERWKALTDGQIGTSWREHYNVTCRLPLHPSVGIINEDSGYNGRRASPLWQDAILFVHGGLSPTYRDITPFPSRINELGLSALKKLQASQGDRLSQAENTLLASGGPLWYRGWADDAEAKVCAAVDRVLDRTGTMSMVMGHTTQLDGQGIVMRCNGKIFLIDTGISSYYRQKGGMASALRFEYSHIPRATASGSGDAQNWVVSTLVTAIYDKSAKILLDHERYFTGNFI